MLETYINRDKNTNIRAEKQLLQNHAGNAVVADVFAQAFSKHSAWEWAKFKARAHARIAGSWAINKMLQAAK